MSAALHWGRDRVGARSWTRLDTVLVAAVTLLALGVRGFGAGRPSGMVWDEFYAADACLYVTPGPGCRATAELTPQQPPLGKWLIGWGIELFGFGPRGWRIAPVLLGSLTVLVLYLMARRLGLSTFGATLAAGLLALDTLHVVLSRTAMLDVFVTFFVVLAYLCLVFDRTAVRPQPNAVPRWSGRWIPPRPWLLLSGVAAGAAVACKWSALPMLAVMIILAVTFFDGARQRRAWTVAAYLVLVPALVYTASYAGRLDGSLLAWPWRDGAWIRSLVERQQQMWQFHVGLDGPNPYASPPWSWLLLKRPVAMYFGEVGGGRYVEVLAVGSPVVWWAGLVAMGHQAYRVIRRRGPALAPIIAVAGFLAGYVPWFAVSASRSQTFLYYLLPAVPFLCLALGLSLDQVVARFWGRAATAILVTGCLASFIFLYPLLAARPVSPDFWRHRILFHDCQEPGHVDAGNALRPRTTAGRPPHGWCWA